MSRSAFRLLFAILLATPVAAQLPPVLDGQPILFVTRKQYAADHHNTHTMFPSAPNETNTGSYTGAGCGGVGSAPPRS